jgi:hypothetical protein
MNDQSFQNKFSNPSWNQKIDTTERYGMLPKFMYQSNRTEQLRAMTAFYRPGNVAVEKTVEIDVSDSYIPLPDLSMLSSYVVGLKKESIIENIRRCYLFFFKDTKYQDNGTFFSVYYRGESINVLSLVVKSFFHWQVYNDITMARDVERDVESGCVRAARLIPARSSCREGQLKITVDAFLTIDALECKDSLKVLIVGSSHDPVVKERSAYEFMPLMLTNSVIDMYDFVEEEGETVIGTNKVRRFRKAYTYATLASYDVLIDDAWYQGDTAFSKAFFASTNKELPPNYSIKTFDEVISSNIYYQVSVTGSERRIVSRSLIPSYRHVPQLGNCPHCIEIMFHIRNDYPDEVYKAILRQHKDARCTPPKWYHDIHSFQKGKEWFEPSWVTMASDKYVVTDSAIEIKDESAPLRRPLFCNIPQLNPVELKIDHLQFVAIVVDHPKMMVKSLKKAKNIYMWDGKVMRKHQPYSTMPTKEVIDQVRVNTSKVKMKVTEDKKESNLKNLSINLRDAATPPDGFSHYQDPTVKWQEKKRIVKEEKLKKMVWREKNPQI